jgi:hypothetical protein
VINHEAHEDHEALSFYFVTFVFFVVAASFVAVVVAAAGA